MIIVFGGAFNPITNGHMKVCDFVLSKFDEATFLFLPVSSAYTKSDLASNYDRLSMIERAIGNRKNVMISQMEMRDSNFLGTYQSLVRIADGYQEDVYFIIGADNLKDMDRWININGLLSDFKFIVLGRDGIDIRKSINDNEILSKFISHFIIFDDFEINVSSTLFRNTFDRNLVPKEVYDYIVEHDLYTGDE